MQLLFQEVFINQGCLVLGIFYFSAGHVNCVNAVGTYFTLNVGRLIPNL